MNKNNKMLRFVFKLLKILKYNENPDLFTVGRYRSRKMHVGAS